MLQRGAWKSIDTYLRLHEPFSRLLILSVGLSKHILVKFRFEIVCLYLFIVRSLSSYMDNRGQGEDTDRAFEHAGCGALVFISTAVFVT